MHTHTHTHTYTHMHTHTYTHTCTHTYTHIYTHAHTYYNLYYTAILRHILSLPTSTPSLAHTCCSVLTPPPPTQRCIPICDPVSKNRVTFGAKVLAPSPDGVVTRVVMKIFKQKPSCYNTYSQRTCIVCDQQGATFKGRTSVKAKMHARTHNMRT